jgi:hypothetical protein
MVNSDIPNGESFADGVFLHPLAACIAYVQENEWENTDNGTTTCHFVIPGDVVEFNSTMQWTPALAEVTVMLSCELACDDERLPHLALALTRANGREDTYGKFVYKESDGLLIWEHTLFLDGMPGVTAEQMVRMIDSGRDEFESHLVALATAANQPLPEPQSSPEPEAQPETHLVLLPFTRLN